MHVGGGTFDLPEACDESPDVKAAQESLDKREALRSACVDVLRDDSPLGRDVLIGKVRERGVKGRNARLRGWLAELGANPESGLVSTAEGFAVSYGPDDAGHSGATPLDAPMAPRKRAQPPISERTRPTSSERPSTRSPGNEDEGNAR